MQMKVNRRLTYATTALAIGVGILLPSVSFAADHGSGGDSAPVTPIANQLIIDGVTYDVAVLPDFDPTGDVVIAGSPQARSVQEQISATDAVTVAPEASALASCTSYSFSIPGTGSTYTSVPGCSFIGLNSSVKATYNWDRNFNSSGTPCMSGRGYYQQTQGSTNYVMYWRGFGCYRTSGSDTVSWGNVASTKQMRGYVTSVPVGWAGHFY